MLKKYEKPVSKLIRTEELCDNHFTRASVISGNDQRTPVSHIEVEEEKDPDDISNGYESSWGYDTWGGE